ncbi:MAG: hypothetical protein ACTHN5_09880 [Phycisphaerae bacterium]
MIIFGWRYQKRGFQNPELDHLRLALSKTGDPHPTPQAFNPRGTMLSQIVGKLTRIGSWAVVRRGFRIGESRCGAGKVYSDFFFFEDAGGMPAL